MLKFPKKVLISKIINSNCGTDCLQKHLIFNAQNFTIMIQRIQSVYLLLTSLLSLLFLNGAYLTFFDNSGTLLKLTLSGLMRFTADNSPEKIGEAWMIYIPVIIVSVLSMISVFLFRNRNLQLAVTRILLVLIFISIAVSLIYTFMILSGSNAEIDNWFKLLIPIVQLIFSWLAFRGIKKDDDLVKSYDRLR